MPLQAALFALLFLGLDVRQLAQHPGGFVVQQGVNGLLRCAQRRAHLQALGVNQQAQRAPGAALQAVGHLLAL